MRRVTRSSSAAAPRTILETNAAWISAATHRRVHRPALAGSSRHDSSGAHPQLKVIRSRDLRHQTADEHGAAILSRPDRTHRSNARLSRSRSPPRLPVSGRATPRASRGRPSDSHASFDRRVVEGSHGNRRSPGRRAQKDAAGRSNTAATMLAAAGTRPPTRPAIRLERKRLRLWRTASSAAPSSAPTETAGPRPFRGTDPDQVERRGHVWARRGRRHVLRQNRAHRLDDRVPAEHDSRSAFRTHRAKGKRSECPGVRAPNPATCIRRCR